MHVKRFVALGLAIPALVLAAAACGSAGSAGSPATAPTPATASQAPVANTDNAISLAEFNQIQVGMTYAQVKAIVGGPGELVSTAGADQYKIDLYTWKAEGAAGLVGASANVTFQAGVVAAKAQLGLK